MYELMLKCAFEVCVSTSSGPDVALFKRFQQSWSQIDLHRYEPGIQDGYVSSTIGGDHDHILQFCLDQLQLHHPREDYKELLEFAVIFLGDQPPDEYRFVFRVPSTMQRGWLFIVTRYLYSGISSD